MARVSEHICAHCGNKQIKPTDKKCSACSSTLADERICQVCQGRALSYNPDSNPGDVVIGEIAVEMNKGTQPEIPGVTHRDDEDTVPWCGICNKLF